MAKMPEQILRTIKDALDSAKDTALDLKKITTEEELQEFLDSFCGYNPDNFLIIKDREGNTRGFLVLGADNSSFIVYLEGDGGVLYVNSAYNIYYRPPEGLIGVLVYIKNQNLGEIFDDWRGAF